MSYRIKLFGCTAIACVTVSDSILGMLIASPGARLLLAFVIGIGLACWSDGTRERWDELHRP
jgi:hypothetical protein